MVAAILDVYRRIIPNYLVIAIFLFGVVRDYLHSDIRGVVTALTYCVAVAVILYPLYMTGSLGAGDVKLYSLLPLYYIREKLLIIYFLTFLIALAFAIIRLLCHPSLRDRIRQFLLYIRYVFFGSHIQPILPGQMPELSFERIPMAVPFAIGILISIIADNTGYIDFYN